jgi:hypothetical protein
MSSSRLNIALLEEFVKDGVFYLVKGLDEMSDEKLTRKQKRDLGILPVQILAHAKDADLNKGMSARELAFAYAAYVSDVPEFQASWGGIESGTYGVDWDNLIEMLTKIMELLLKFLPLFI